MLNKMFDKDFMDNSDVNIKNKLEEKEESNSFNSLNIVCASDLAHGVQIPDELIQDVLLSNGLSVIYGDSNCGKTFFAIDMAAAISRGEMWMNKNTEQGIVIYLASEAPGSVAMRLHAYQKYFEVSLPNFYVVQKSVNLYDENGDYLKIIELIKHYEKQKNQKVRLVVGDTLASLSAGADENVGKDMGLIINRAGEIRNQCNTHFSLIHHSGKNIAAGARGWSGLRAAVDTEIQVTESELGKCAEIKKLRDLGPKGERIGFRLQSVPIGRSKWNKEFTSCIVKSMEAPPIHSLKNTKKESDVSEAILKFLSGKNSEIPRHTKAEINRGILEFKKTAIYDQINKLTELGKLINNNGIYELNRY